MGSAVLRSYNYSVMGKLFGADFRRVTEYFLNLVVLNKKSQKAGRLLKQLEKAVDEDTFPAETEELRQANALLNNKAIDFVQLKYPRAYFKLAVFLNIYPIPIATAVIVMIYQRFAVLSGHKLILVSLCCFSLALVVMIWMEFLIRRTIKTTAFHRLIVAQRKRRVSSAMTLK